MADRLSDRTAIVTGAAQGIGRTIARRLSEEGADVLIADVQGERARSIAAELDDQVDSTVVAEPCDVTDLHQAQSVVDRAEAAFDGVDVLVNNAGVGGHGTFPQDVGPEAWHEVVDVNLHGTYNLSYAAAPGMIDREYGRMINISSMAGRGISYHGAASYTASKWAIIGFTKHLAWDLGGAGITVNAVCPGSTETPLLAENSTAEERARVEREIPLGRWATPEDQANGVVFLASEEASYVTGTVLEIDGGKQLNPRHDG